MKKTMNRRQFLKFSGAGLAGIGLSTLNVPFFRLGKASAALSSDAWCFGVMSDTQWTSTSGGENTCATGIIDALNQQFIEHGCKFVIQVGDLVDKDSYSYSIDGSHNLATHAAHREVLYNNGIGFYPLRGNHESSAAAANEFVALWPQTQGEGDNVNGATNFVQSDIEALEGLSYSFDYENVRCVMIDQFVRKDGTNYDGTTSYNNNMVDQVAWVDDMVSSRPDDYHAFVLSHKNLIGGNHKDNLFGSALTSNSDSRDTFLESMFTNNVACYISGHDHMHHRSLVWDSSLNYNVQQLITSSNSYKFYTPELEDGGRETMLQEELYTIGYYIFTVEGPRLTIDFYSSSTGEDYGSVSLTSYTEQPFYLRERFGYSLNGSRFEIAQGESYISIADSYNDTTTAQILSGTNSNDETDLVGRDLTKTVNTGWADGSLVDDAASDIFTLWGLVDNLSLYDEALTGALPNADESQVTDTYTLSISYNPKKIRASKLMRGSFCIAARNEDDAWVNAVDLNDGGTKTFKRGPWKSGYELGTYGVDPSTKTVWAVINHEGDFVAKLI